MAEFTYLQTVQVPALGEQHSLMRLARHDATAGTYAARMSERLHTIRP